MTISHGNQNSSSPWQYVQIFSVKLVLEVIGAGGAIWGFSEALGLRTNETIYFWRPCALSISFIFFIRWILQLHQHWTTKQGGYEEQISMTAHCDDDHDDLALQTTNAYHDGKEMH